ncbi:LPS-assembly protein LptD [Brucepastera parasyntrophica]|uniref:LPS-assembly protein LptD n=1 Tax=Brucepastera parasyntrophica TaxID=2880008 RepID=UPI00210B2205|nr:LPS-assembly protein LptD [Brucepastera parasyntrophica]ULQ59918.1 LPS-assembly protein LptD [Brucepastera parasyntrophica]
MIRRFLVSVIVFFLIPAFFYAADRVVTIESARFTEYIKLDPATDTEILVPPDHSGTVEKIRFTGNVVIVVTEGSSVSRIGADEITYDKSRDMLEASGNVSYEHTTGKSGSEKFSGTALLFNIRTQEGVFLGGSVVQDSGRKDGDPYTIHAEVSGRDSSSTMAFKNGVMTTCDEEDPHWSITASRIWILPGNEIAILNGVFFIGPLPVFYIPAFYYPSDEMIFHPVFGYRNREGNFIQTTTYLIGRKPLASKSSSSSGTSFADFLQSDTLKEQKREGLFLRNTNEDATTANSNHLKLLLDGYSGLGAMIGVDGLFRPTKGYVRSISFYANFGFSRTLYSPQSGISYTTYDSNGDQNWNSGWFFGNKLPFRYNGNLSMQMDRAPFAISVSIPLISDSKFRADFLDRGEDLNWFNFLMNQAELAKGSDISDETSYSWNISGSIRPTMSVTRPWLETFSITSLTGLLTFNSKTNLSLSGEELAYSPERTFFYPEVIKPSMNISLGGTLLSSTKRSQTTQTKTVSPDMKDIFNPFAEAANIDNQAENSNDSLPDKADVDRFIKLPGITPKIAATSGLSSYSVTWSMDPSFIYEARYNATDWLAPDEIQWDEFSSLYYQVKLPAKIQGSYKWDSNFFSATSSLNFSSLIQDHPWLSDSVYTTQSAKDTIKVNNYKATMYSISTTENISIVPFNRNDFLKPISASWNFTGNIVKSEFTGTADDPEWDSNLMKWDRDYITTHSATGVVGVAFGNYTQRISVTSNLPPLLESYTGSASFAWPYTTVTVNTKFYEKETSGQTDWIWDPLRTSIRFTFPFNLSLGQDFVYNIEDNEPSRLHITAGYKNLSAYYTLNTTIPYKLVEGQGWLQDGTETKFIPSDAGFSYTNSPLKLNFWKNRISIELRVSTNLKFDLLRLTSSSFTFTPGITIKILDFLDFTFSSNSTNEVIARYFQDWMDLPAPLPGETNILVDLFKSFNFFNEQDRMNSGFKLKRLNMELKHYLHDWTMSLKVAIAPELKTSGGNYRYEFSPTITFVVEWKPISDIKTTVKTESGVFSLNTTDDDDD